MDEIGFSDIRDCFSSFATSAMWRESREIVAKAEGAGHLRHSLIRQMLAEIRALISLDAREFITVVCVKKNDKK